MTSLLTRRTAVAGLAATGVFAPSIVRAQGYPSGQTIKMLVPYPAGGATDIVRTHGRRRAIATLEDHRHCRERRRCRSQRWHGSHCQGRG